MLNIVNYLEWNLNFPVFVSFIVLTLKYSNLFFSYDKILLLWLKKAKCLNFLLYMSNFMFCSSYIFIFFCSQNLTTVKFCYILLNYIFASSWIYFSILFAWSRQHVFWSCQQKHKKKVNFRCNGRKNELREAFPLQWALFPRFLLWELPKIACGWGLQEKCSRLKANMMNQLQMYYFLSKWMKLGICCLKAQSRRRYSLWWEEPRILASE